MELGNVIAKLRREKGLNQRDFAEAIGVSNGTVAMWEKNKRNPNLKTLEKISDFFDIPIDILLKASDSLDSYTINKLTPEERNLVDYFRRVSDLDLIPEKEKKEISTFFDFVSILHEEEKELLDYYNELSLKDRRWIMGQMIDLIKKSDEN